MTYTISEVTVTIGGVAITGTFGGGDPRAFVASILRAAHQDAARGLLRRAKAIRATNQAGADALTEYAVAMLAEDPLPEGFASQEA